jgi:alpha-beta hydrolase superfamily lysophospholipase
MPNSTFCIYLHGFASGPNSEKAQFFKQNLERCGIGVEIPDLNQPAFQTMTLTRQLEQVKEVANEHARNARIILAGSSMGGLVASLLAQRMSNFAALILFAPGFGINRRWQELLGENGLRQWQTEGVRYFDHHMLAKPMPLNFSFVEDMRKYDSENIKVNVPTLLIHGQHDEVVPKDESSAFAKNNPDSVRMHILDSDHGLLNVLPQMWTDIENFLNGLDLLPKN